MEHWKSVNSLLSRWGFGLAFFCFMGIIFTAFNTVITFKEFSSWIDHTHEVLRELNRVETLIERAESTQRTYLLARDPNILKRYYQSLERIPSTLARLERLTSNNGEQALRVKQLGELVRARMEHMSETLRRTAKLSASEAAKEIDLQANAVLQERAKEIEDNEQRLLAQRKQAADHFAEIAIQLILLGAAFTLATLLINRRALSKSASLHLNQSLLLNSIFDSMSSGLMVVDAKGVVTKFNRKAEELIGLAPVGSNPETRIRAGGLTNIATGQPLKKEESVLTRCLVGMPVNNFEVLSKREGHPNRVLNVDGRPIFGPDGKVTGALALFQDITERKNLEDEWQRAREAALEASRLKSDFLAAMSHEIRTPMNGVIGMTTLLLDTRMSEEQKSFVKTIKSSADSLLTLINQLLDHTKIESGKLELDVADFNLHELLESIMGMFRYAARSKNIDLQLHFEDDVPKYVRGDSGRLRQILINLIGNGLKFTEKGFIRVSISTVLCSEILHKVMFEVKDTGPGIPKEVQAKLFQKFAQVHTKNFSYYGGTGLGLMISKELTRLMKGEIGLESAEGFGSRFWFTAEFGLAEQVVHSPLNPSTERLLYKGHVLVVDDQPINQSVITKFLQIFGLTSRGVTNGQEALEAWERETFDLILMDCQMPVMDGYEATIQIRQREKARNQHIPIIALTAEGRSSDRERCFKSGMDDFLTKPLDIDLLGPILGKYLNSTEKVDHDLGCLEKLMNFDSNGRPLALVLAEDYLKATPAMISELRAAANAKDWLAMSDHAHALHSTSLTLGLTKVGALCAQIESTPRTELLSELEVAWTAACLWLKKFASNKSSQVA